MEIFNGFLTRFQKFSIMMHKRSSLEITLTIWYMHIVSKHLSWTVHEQLAVEFMMQGIDPVVFLNLQLSASRTKVQDIHVHVMASVATSSVRA